MNIGLSLILLSAAQLLTACGGEAHKFVPGQPLQFPLEAKPALAHMGEGLLKNCRAEDANVQSSCTVSMKRRVSECLPEVEVLNQAEYRQAARAYVSCVMPRPICDGVEVDDIASCDSGAR